MKGKITTKQYTTLVTSQLSLIKTYITPKDVDIN